MSRIVVYNRLDPACIERARTLSVLVSPDGEEWDLVHTHHGLAFGGIDGHPLEVQLSGHSVRFVRLRLNSHEFFHLDEVEVYD